jgi:hypothetical protein
MTKEADHDKQQSRIGCKLVLGINMNSNKKSKIYTMI